MKGFDYQVPPGGENLGPLNGVWGNFDDFEKGGESLSEGLFDLCLTEDWSISEFEDKVGGEFAFRGKKKEGLVVDGMGSTTKDPICILFTVKEELDEFTTWAERDST